MATPNKFNFDIEDLKHRYLALKQSTHAIGRHFGADHRLINYHLKRAGVVFRPIAEWRITENAVRLESEKDQIFADRNSGMTIEALQKKYVGLGQNRISDLCRTLDGRSLDETLFERRSNSSKRVWANLPEDKKESIRLATIASNGGSNNHNFGKVWGGKGRGTRIASIDSYGRPINFRSTWEAKFADYLNASGFKWKYEPQTFKCGALGTYTPDFYVDSWECFVEVKGWLTEKAKAKIDWFRENCVEPLILADKNVLRNQFHLEIR